jgi:hypothetical protein
MITWTRFNADFFSSEIALNDILDLIHFIIAWSDDWRWSSPSKIRQTGRHNFKEHVICLPLHCHILHNRQFQSWRKGRGLWLWSCKPCPNALHIQGHDNQLVVHECTTRLAEIWKQARMVFVMDKAGGEDAIEFINSDKIDKICWRRDDHGGMWTYWILMIF